MTTYPTRIEMMAALPAGATIVEVGVQRGDFSEAILANQVKLLTLVDPWARMPNEDPRDPASISQGGHDENHRHVINRFTPEIARGRVRVLRQPSPLAARQFGLETQTAVYIDGNHSYDAALADLIAWAPKVKQGGYLMGHDFTEAPEALHMGFGVVKAVTEFCRLQGWVLDAVTEEFWASFRLKRA